MSTDWERYSTPAETQKRASVPEDNGVLSLPVEGTRNEAKQIVTHAPDEERKNRAHTDVMGDKKSDPETRTILARLAEWKIRLILPT